MSPSNDVEALAEYSHPYLDSSVYVAVIQGEDGRVEDTRQILRNAERNELRIVATTLVLAEVHKAGTADWTTDKIDRYFHRPHFLWVEVDYPLGVRARTLAREHRLRGADAIHLAGALRVVPTSSSHTTSVFLPPLMWESVSPSPSSAGNYHCQTNRNKNCGRSQSK